MQLQIQNKKKKKVNVKALNKTALRLGQKFLRKLNEIQGFQDKDSCLKHLNFMYHRRLHWRGSKITFFITTHEFF